VEIVNKVKVSRVIEILIFISVFINSYIFFRYPFEGYLHYLVFLGLIPLFMLKYGYPKYLIQIFIWFIVVGLVSVWAGIYPMFDFIKVFGGMFLSFTFYHYVLKYYQFNLLQLFSVYLKWSYVAAIIGLVQIVSYKVGFLYGYNFRWIFNKWGVNEGGLLGIRVNSVFSEPSGLAAALAPAAYVAVYNLVHKKNFILSKKASIIILITYVLSSSSTAYLGLLIIFVLVIATIKFRFLLIGLGIGGLFFSTIYSVSEGFRSRVDSSIGLWVYQDYTLENTNTSSFVLYNSFHVARESIKEYPFFGTGLGSFKSAFEKHSLTKNVEVIAYDFEFNTTDGNSLFVRMMVELGGVGIFLIIVLMVKGFIYLRAEDEFIQYKIISQAILILILLNLLRQGNYFLNGFPLFILIYYYNWKQYKKAVKLKSDKFELNE
jgi:O-antigen ligase